MYIYATLRIYAFQTHMFEINCPRTRPLKWEKIRRLKEIEMQTVHSKSFCSATSIIQGDHHFKVHNEQNHNVFAVASGQQLTQHNSHYHNENWKKNVHAIKLLNNKHIHI